MCFDSVFAVELMLYVKFRIVRYNYNANNVIVHN